MESSHRSPARLLAPIALAVFAVALLLVITTSGGSEEDSGGSANSAEEARDLGGKGTEEPRREKEKASTDEEEEPTEDVYVVEEGDTLGGIAESTGVPVERLQELNPGLDQFSLVAGQEIKLR
jgi:LysM repeat protein